MDDKKNVLVVAAHPDDEVLGCGGTIYELSKTHKVSVVFLTCGGDETAEEINQTTKELKSVRDILSYSNAGVYTLFAENDNRLDSHALLDVVAFIENTIRIINPSIILTHSLSELNVDHQVAHKAVVTATRPPCCNVETIMAFSVPEATLFNYDTSFRPNVFVKLGEEEFNKKIEALTAYSSRIRGGTYPRDVKAMETVCRYYGYMAGVQYAEAFEAIRIIT